MRYINEIPPAIGNEIYVKTVVFPPPESLSLAIKKIRTIAIIFKDKIAVTLIRKF